MGITVEMKNGEKMDGEQFVIGMAASELSYIKEEEALKAWMIVCRTNFVKAASGENSSKKQKNLNLDYVSMKELEENNGRKAYLEIKKKLEDAATVQMMIAKPPERFANTGVYFSTVLIAIAIHTAMKTWLSSLAFGTTTAINIP